MSAEEKICIGNQNVNDAEYPVVREGVFSEDDAARKKKRKLGKNKLNVDVSDESQFIDCNKSEMGLDDNHLESSNSAQPPSEGSDASGSKKSSSIVNFGRKKETIPQVTNDNKPDSNFGGAGSMAEPKKRKRERIKTTPPPDHIHITDATKSDPGLMENVLLTCPGQNFHDADTKKRKKNKCGRKKEYIQGEVSFMDKENLDSEPVKNVLETGLGSKLPEIENVHSLDNSSEKTIKIRRKRKRRRKKVVAAIEEQVVDTKAPDAFPNPTVQFQCERACMISDLSEKMLNENMVIKAKKRRKKKKAKSFPAEGTVDISTEDAESLENLAYENAANNGKRKRNSKKIIVDGHVQGQKNGEAADAEKTDGEICLYPKRELPALVRRKLLVLDLNGLLADIIMPAPKNSRGYFKIHGRAVVKRPFFDDFLKFCFQNFDIGIWSSRRKGVIDSIASSLLGNLKDRLLFCWNTQHCTQSGFSTLENDKKPLVFKELRKIWESNDPKLPWKMGDYDESNTLLLDDSPYKALLNPLHTAIFPRSYCYLDEGDNALGPEGDIRLYLEGLLESDNVQKYVEQRPFGQNAIDEQDESWEFYSEVLQKMSILPKHKQSDQPAH